MGRLVGANALLAGLAAVGFLLVTAAGVAVQAAGGPAQAQAAGGSEAAGAA
jgi:hypothetical protein